MRILNTTVARFFGLFREDEDSLVTMAALCFFIIETQRPAVGAGQYSKNRIRLLTFREHNMRRVLRGLVLRHRKSQRGQVNAAKKCLTLTEGNR